MIITVLQVIAAIATILTGLYSLFKPTAITGFTGLQPIGGRGITEIRSILGGVFIALGVVPLALNSTDAYLMLGITYLVIGLVRAISMFLDKSVISSNIISLVVEILFGVVLVIPA